MGRFLTIALVVVAVVYFAGHVKVETPTATATPSTPTAPTATSTTSPVRLAAAAANDTLTRQQPTQQAEFLRVIERYKAAYDAASNDMARGAVRPQRANAICALIRSSEIRDWVGTVKKLSSNGDGKGVLEIALNDHTTVKTWNNAVSDSSDNTLIVPGSAVHNAAVTLRQGQAVTFSGRFIGRGRSTDTDCLRESSLTMQGSMTDPEWIFKFTAIAPL